MPRKSLAPGFVVLKYTTTVGTIVFSHEMVVPVNVVVWAGSSTLLTLKNGTTAAWATAMLAFIATFQPLYHTSSVFTAMELWRQDSATSDPQLIELFTLVSILGTSAGATVQASGACFTFRSTEDSGYRLLLIESNQAVDQRRAYSSMSATQKAPVDYLLGVTSLLYARSNAYLASFGLFTSKTYDVVRKKRLGL